MKGCLLISKSATRIAPKCWPSASTTINTNRSVHQRHTSPRSTLRPGLPRRSRCPAPGCFLSPVFDDAAQLLKQQRCPQYDIFDVLASDLQRCDLFQRVRSGVTWLAGKCGQPEE